MKASPRGNPLQRSGGTSRRALKREDLRIIGARENNLKNLSVTIPANKFVVVTGPSWFGQVFPCLRRHLCRRTTTLHGVHVLLRPSIRQPTRQTGNRLPLRNFPYGGNRAAGDPGSRKSTVGSTTEIAQFLRLLYSRIGVQLSTVNQERLTSNTEAEVIAGIKEGFSISKPSPKNLRSCFAPL